MERSDGHPLGCCLRHFAKRVLDHVQRAGRPDHDRPVLYFRRRGLCSSYAISDRVMPQS
jgi:hypothetical protein